MECKFCLTRQSTENGTTNDEQENELYKRIYKKNLSEFLKIKGEIQTTNQEDDLENIFLLDLQSS